MPAASPPRRRSSSADRHLLLPRRRRHAPTVKRRRRSSTTAPHRPAGGGAAWRADQQEHEEEDRREDTASSRCGHIGWMVIRSMQVVASYLGKRGIERGHHRQGSVERARETLQCSRSRRREAALRARLYIEDRACVGTCG
jgi:hypothetical protein